MSQKKLTRRDSVDDDFLIARKVVRCLHHYCQDNGKYEQPDCELTQSPLQRRSNIDSQEPPNGVRSRESPSLNVVVEEFLPLIIPPDLPNPRISTLQTSGDCANLRTHTGSGDDTPRSAFGDRGGGEGHVETIADADGVGVRLSVIFSDWCGLAGKEGFVGFEVHGVDETDVGGYDVAGLEIYDVAGDEVARGDGLVAGGTDDSR